MAAHPEAEFLQWVLVEDALRNVSDFAHLPPAERPLSICPVCQEPVTLKLGKKRVHHFAHRPDAVCAATQPETALHLNCKYHLYDQLSEALRLVVTVHCSRCGAPRDVVWKRDWDAVQVEHSLGSTRPDLTLSRAGEVIGAIEVLVTHAVPAEKSAELRNRRIDWVEVRGSTALYEGDTMWTPSMPLDVIRVGSSTFTEYCERCRIRNEWDEFRRRNRIGIRSACLVDLYYHTGRKYRYAFYVKVAYRGGQEVRSWIEDQNRDVLASESSSLDQARVQLWKVFQEKIADFHRIAAVVDERTGWVTWEHGQRVSPGNLFVYPFRFEWNAKARHWTLSKYQQR